jgi:hypothetical protein
MGGEEGGEQCWVLPKTESRCSVTTLLAAPMHMEMLRYMQVIKCLAQKPVSLGRHTLGMRIHSPLCLLTAPRVPAPHGSVSGAGVQEVGLVWEGKLRLVDRACVTSEIPQETEAL